MELPNKENAYVDLEKIRDYLISEKHAVGKSKAKLFRSFGYNEGNVNLLIAGLVSIVKAEKIKEAIPTEYGVKYIIDGKLKTPDGRLLEIRTVWIINKGEEKPRFVTAYPL